MDDLQGINELFREIHPRYGKFAVAGNHEFHAGLDRAVPLLKGMGFRVLRNEAIEIAPFLWIAGIDDPVGKTLKFSKAEQNPRSVLRAPRTDFTLLLKHRPEVDKSSSDLFDLQLSGHAHGGQIFPFGFITRLRYLSDGLHILSQSSSICVSRGSGTWGPPIRFLSPPEVIVIELRPVTNASSR
jgi:predicted MPP superfamily phosphohydrolase